MATTYDSKCYELAVHFLEDVIEPVPVSMARDLAAEIQQTIEDFMEGQGL